MTRLGLARFCLSLVFGAPLLACSYDDGNFMTLSLCGTLIEYNEVNAYGAAIFFVSNDYSGILRIHDSVIRNDIGGSWHLLPGISMHDDTTRDIVSSTIE